MFIKLKSIKILILLLTFSVLSIGHVRALSPGLEVNDCYNNPFAYSDCKRILCEFRNLDRNWPENTGYFENCLGIRHLIISLYALTVTGILTWVILKKIKKRKQVKQSLK